MPAIPVTVLTGYLGAGKTTLLNRLLVAPHGKRYAVIVNEFGELGIDNDLVVDVDEEIFEMNNGCICCTVRGDLIRILAGLLKRKGEFDGILIETTGLADPAPVAQTFFVDEDLAERTRLDAIVTVADAKFIEERLADSHEAEEQIAFADVLLLNKTDLVTPADLERIERRVRAINPYARIVRTQRCDVALDAVMGLEAFDLKRVLEVEPDFLEAHDHEHDAEVRSVSLTADAPLQPEVFFGWFQQLLATQGPNILRSKGILDLAGESDRYVVQGVHMLMDGDLLGPWKAGEPRRSRLVLIGRHLDEGALKDGFADCVATQS